ncbi:MAG: FkbM family methyltransferase [Bacteroidota bacterium]|nr:FkbM family methyltransferase [Bacteroidota bacterium]
MKMIKKLFNFMENYANKKFKRRLNKSLFELSKINKDFSLNFIDVGAAEDIHPRWKRISKYVDYIGFEPDKRSRELLLKYDDCKSYKIYPYALWNKKQKLNINFTKEPRVSSSYVPNYKFLNQFKRPERFEIESNVKVDATDLDNLKIKGIDFIKIDVQGGELNIISGAETSLKDCIGLELEVEFLELYEKQPLFGDLQNKLSKFGFEFIDFVNLCRWERDDFNGFGQCVFGDALFLKSPEQIFSVQDQHLISRYVAILLLYKRFDLIEKCFLLMNKNQIMQYGLFKKSLEYHRKKYNNLKIFHRIFNALVRLNHSDNQLIIHY